MSDMNIPSKVNIFMACVGLAGSEN